MRRRLLVGASLMVLTVFVVPAAELPPSETRSSPSGCLKELAQTLGEGFELAGLEVIKNEDSSLSFVFAFCPTCRQGPRPCAAPCRLAVVTVGPDGVTCR